MRIQPAQHAVEPRRIVASHAKTAAGVLETLTRDIDRGQPISLGKLADRRGRAVDELRAKFDRHARLRRRGSFDATTDAIARLEHEDIEPALDEDIGGREPCCTSADYDDVGISTVSPRAWHESESALLRSAPRLSGCAGRRG